MSKNHPKSPPASLGLLPDFVEQLSHRHVTRQLVWEAYKRMHPDGYEKSQLFCCLFCFCWHLFILPPRNLYAGTSLHVVFWLCSSGGALPDTFPGFLSVDIAGYRYLLMRIETSSCMMARSGFHTILQCRIRCRYCSRMRATFCYNFHRMRWWIRVWYRGK